MRRRVKGFLTLLLSASLLLVSVINVQATAPVTEERLAAFAEGFVLPRLAGGANPYFETWDAAADEMVICKADMTIKSSGAYEEYLSAETGQYEIPHAIYLGIADQYFFNHSDLTGVLGDEGRYQAETQIVTVPQGGFGDAVRYDYQGAVQVDANTYQLQLNWVDYGGAVEMVTPEVMTVRCTPDRGIVVLGLAKVDQLTEDGLFQDTDGVIFMDDGSQYSRFSVVHDPKNSAVTLQGNYTLDGQAGLWCKAGESVRFTVKADTGYQVSGVGSTSGTVTQSADGSYEAQLSGQAAQIYVDIELTYTIQGDTAVFEAPGYGTAYRLAMELGSGITYEGLVFGNPDTTKETLVIGNESGGQDFYLWPDSTTYLSFDVSDEAAFENLELEPADAGELIRTPGGHVLGIRLNKPAVLRQAQKEDIVLESQDGVIISAAAEDAAWLAGIQLVTEKVTKTEKDQDQAVIQTSLGDKLGPVSIFEIRLEDTSTGESKQPQSPVQISLPIPEGWNAKNLKVYYVDGQTGQLTDMKGSVSEDGNYFTFTTNHFSHYALVQLKTEESSKPVEEISSAGQSAGGKDSKPNPSGSPKTGDANQWFLWLGILLAGGISVIGLVEKRKKVQ